VVLAPVGDTEGWFDTSRDGGFIRRAANSYLPEAGDAWISPQLMRQWGVKKGDHVHALVGRDPRGRLSAMEIQTINGADPALSLKRQDFQSLTAAYPERKLYLETGRPAKGGHELTRRAVDLVAPIGYGQRALIVAPARDHGRHRDQPFPGRASDPARGRAPGRAERGDFMGRR